MRNPATNWNCLSVGATGNFRSVTGDLSQYDQVASFSSRSPSDFLNPQTGVITPGVRAAVHILAPGTNMVLATYFARSGSNLDGDFGPQFDGPPSPQDYSRAWNGTSMAAPVVAGGAALLVDAGKANFAPGVATRAPVIKAVLVNSADKLAGWDKGQHVDPDGVVRTRQVLDWTQGAGQVNLYRAYDQYLSGTNDVPGTGGGPIARIGWDAGVVSDAAAHNDYPIAGLVPGGLKLTATLDWLVAASWDGSFDPDYYVPEGTYDFMSNLDLQVLFSPDGLGSYSLIAESNTIYNNIQHLYLDLPEDGYYMLRVTCAGEIYDVGDHANIQDYGLAWSVAAVPEPGGVASILAFGVIGLRRRRRA